MTLPSPGILCVEDDKDSCKLISFMFREADEDFTITFVETGEKALELIAKQPFDLYILDYTLPEITGVELCRRLREIDKQAPIIFFTGMTHWRDRKAAIKAGADEYLVKPDDLDRLIETASRLLARKSSNTSKPQTVSKDNR